MCHLPGAWTGDSLRSKPSHLFWPPGSRGTAIALKLERATDLMPAKRAQEAVSVEIAVRNARSATELSNKMQASLPYKCISASDRSNIRA